MALATPTPKANDPYRLEIFLSVVSSLTKALATGVLPAQNPPIIRTIKAIGKVLHKPSIKEEKI